MIRGLQPHIPNSTIVECNVLYPSPRQKTETHREVLKTNGFDFCPVDIMDADGDASLPVKGMREFLDGYSPFASTTPPFTPGVHLTEVSVGKNLLNYDSLLCTPTSRGTRWADSADRSRTSASAARRGRAASGKSTATAGRRARCSWSAWSSRGKGIVDHFGAHITYINVLKNISVDCDCDAHGAKPTCNDIGIVASRDILAIDKASVDLVFSQPELQRHDIVERIQSRGGLHQL